MLHFLLLKVIQYKAWYIERKKTRTISFFRGGCNAYPRSISG